MNRKGVVGDTITGWILKFTLMIIVVLAVIIMVRAAISQEVDTFPLEASLLAHRIIAVPGGISYIDADTASVELGVIDFDRMGESREFLADIISTSRSVRVEVKGATLYAETFIDKAGYERLEVYYRARGASRIKGYEIAMPIVLYSEQDKIRENGIVRITVLGREE